MIKELDDSADASTQEAAMGAVGGAPRLEIKHVLDKIKERKKKLVEEEKETRELEEATKKLREEERKRKEAEEEENKRQDQLAKEEEVSSDCTKVGKRWHDTT